MPKKLFLLFVITLLITSGCTTTEVVLGSRLDARKTDNITIGKTTDIEIIDLFGPPNSAGMTSDGFVVYTFTQLKMKSQAWIIFPLFAVHINMVATNMVKVLSVTFRDRVVVNYRYCASTQEGGLNGMENISNPNK
ncbi:MAG: hypothetical protein ABIH42_04635 [Planctomycetota bacterium]